MGYFFLAVALFFGVSKGFFGKKTSHLMTGSADAVTASMLRMAICTLLGICMIIPDLANRGLAGLCISGDILLTVLISGIANAVSVVIWLLIVRQGALVLVDVFSLLGMLIPLVGSRILFGESIAGKDWFGFGLLLVATFLICSYQNAEKKRMEPREFGMLILMGISVGTMDFTQKIFSNQSNGEVSASVFNLYTYFIAFLCLAGYTLVLRFRCGGRIDSHQKPMPKGMLFAVFLMAVSLYLMSLLKTLAAGYLPSVLLYPLYQGGILICCAAMGAICFGERLTLKSIFGILLSVIALMIINVF